MRTLTLTTLLALSSTASAAPIVWHKVPDGMLDDVAGAEQELSDEQAALTNAEQAIEVAKADVDDAKDKLQDARKERRLKRAEAFGAFTDWVAARRNGDEALIEQRTQELLAAEEEWDTAKQHVTWHRQAKKAEKVGVREARVEKALARAELEEAQADVLTAAKDAPFYDGERFDEQVDGLDHRRAVVESTRVVWEAETSESRATWTAMAE